MKILIPIDESSFSKAAVAFVASRTTLIQRDPTVELLNVQYPVPLRAARALGKQAVLDYQQSEAKKVFRPAQTVLKRAGLVADTKMVIGSPGAEVGRVAAATGADLIVMGSHGRTGFKKLLLGSVTSTVLASCATPMLVLRDKPTRHRDSLNLGIALDGSKYGLAVVRYVIRHIELFGATPTLTLIHVVPDLLGLVRPGFLGAEKSTGIRPDQVEAMQATAFVNAMVPARKLLAKSGLTVKEVRLQGNNAGDEIATFAKKAKLSLLALGSHGQGALQAAVLGSVATRVTLRCQTPLLFVRKP